MIVCRYALSNNINDLEFNRVGAANRQESVTWPQNAQIIPFIRWQGTDTGKRFISERRKKRSEYERKGGRRAEQAMVETGPSPLDAFLPQEPKPAPKKKGGKYGRKKGACCEYSGTVVRGEVPLVPKRCHLSTHIDQPRSARKRKVRGCGGARGGYGTCIM